jgi:hypothetical protein
MGNFWKVIPVSAVLRHDFLTFDRLRMLHFKRIKDRRAKTPVSSRFNCVSTAFQPYCHDVSTVLSEIQNPGGWALNGKLAVTGNLNLQ